MKFTRKEFMVSTAAFAVGGAPHKDAVDARHETDGDMGRAGDPHDVLREGVSFEVHLVPQPRVHQTGGAVGAVPAPLPAPREVHDGRGDVSDAGDGVDFSARHAYLKSIGIPEASIVNLKYYDYARSKYLALGMKDTMPPR